MSNKKHVLLGLVALGTLLRVYSLMAIDWTTVELNELLAPVGLVISIATFVYVLYLHRVE